MSRFTLIDTDLWRGPRPTVDEMTAWSPKLRTIVDLEPPKYEGPEAVAAKRLGISEVPIPMSSVVPPTYDEVRTAAAMLGPVGSVAWRPLLVHCKQGVDRTGVVVAYWRVRYCGFTQARAYDEMLAMGYHWLRYAIWARRVHELLNDAWANR